MQVYKTEIKLLKAELIIWKVKANNSLLEDHSQSTQKNSEEIQNIDLRVENDATRDSIDRTSVERTISESSNNVLTMSEEEPSEICNTSEYHIPVLESASHNGDNESKVLEIDDIGEYFFLIDFILYLYRSGWFLSMKINFVTHML
jgi:hypothetical protein